MAECSCHRENVSQSVLNDAYVSVRPYFILLKVRGAGAGSMGKVNARETGRGRDSERKREGGEIDRETVRQTDKDTETERERHRQADIQRQTDRDREGSTSVGQPLTSLCCRLANAHKVNRHIL